MKLPFVSVVVPAHNAAATLPACLAVLREQDWPRDRYEIVCVDDASTDRTAALAGGLADRVVRLEARPSGPAAARNAGAAAAAGEILVFLDADIVPRRSTVRELAGPLAADRSLAAIFGSYDAQPAHPGLISQYRNLLHHYVHQISRSEAETFWAGCGAVRRDAFEHAGRFDGARYARPSIEDIELGHRMRELGMRIRLDPAIQVQHLKRWTLGGMLRTDILARGIPWMRLLLARRQKAGEVGDLNVRLAAMASIPLAWTALLLVPFALWSPRLGLTALTCAGLVVVLNAPTYRYLARVRGWAFALGSVPLHFLYHLGNGVSVAVALGERYVWGRSRRGPGGRPPVARGRHLAAPAGDHTARRRHVAEERGRGAMGPAEEGEAR